MLDFILNNYSYFTLPVLILVSLLLVHRYIKNQIKKEKQEMKLSFNKDNYKLSEDEIDRLAIYVSHLPRTKDLLKKLDIDEEENK